MLSSQKNLATNVQQKLFKKPVSKDWGLKA